MQKLRNAKEMQKKCKRNANANKCKINAKEMQKLRNTKETQNKCKRNAKAKKCKRNANEMQNKWKINAK